MVDFVSGPLQFTRSRVLCTTQNTTVYIKRKRKTGRAYNIGTYMYGTCSTMCMYMYMYIHVRIYTYVYTFVLYLSRGKPPLSVNYIPTCTCIIHVVLPPPDPMPTLNDVDIRTCTCIVRVPDTLST